MSDMNEFFKAAADAADAAHADVRRRNYQETVAIRQAIDIPVMEERHPLLMGLIAKFTSYPLPHKKISLEVDARNSRIGIAVCDAEENLLPRRIDLTLGKPRTIQIKIKDGMYTFAKGWDVYNMVEPLERNLKNKTETRQFKDEKSAAMYLAQWFGTVLPYHPELTKRRETGLPAGDFKNQNNGIRKLGEELRMSLFAPK